MNSRKDQVGRTTATHMQNALFLVLGIAVAMECWCGAGADSAPSEQTPASCTVAIVGGVVVTSRDAELLRALVQPPLTAGEARRLAVAVTAAYMVHHASSAPPPIEGRFATYRRVLREGGDRGGDREDQSDLTGDRPAIVLGPCGYDASPGSLSGRSSRRL